MGSLDFLVVSLLVNNGSFIDWHAAKFLRPDSALNLTGNTNMGGAQIETTIFLIQSPYIHREIAKKFARHFS